MGLLIDRIRGVVQVTSEVFQTERIAVPGIGTGAAYADGDAFGRSFAIEVPKEGVIANVVFLDYDDEGLNKDLVLFSRPFAETADNAAFAPSDADLAFCVGVASITVWYNFENNQVGMGTPALGYTAQKGKLWGQWRTRGSDNIAAATIPEFYLVIT